MGEKIFCIALSSGFLLIAFAVRRLLGSWAAPGALFSVFWFGYTAIPLLVLFNVDASAHAVSYLLAAAAAYALGGIAIASVMPATGRGGKHEVGIGYDLRAMRLVILSFSFLAIVSLIVNSYLQGFPLDVLLANLHHSAAVYTEKRYAEEIDRNAFITIANIACYSSAAFSGVYLGASKNKAFGVALVVIALLPSVLVMVTQSSKGMLFLSLAYVFGGVVLSRKLEGKSSLIGKEEVKVLVVIAVIVLPFLVFSFLSRGLYDETDSSVVTAALVRYFVSYACAHLYAFSDWFSWYIGSDASMIYAQEPSGRGFYTFMPILQAFGDAREVVPGVYEEYFSYEDVIQSNIYTMYRGAIADFGLWGVMVFMFLIGMLSQLVFAFLGKGARATDFSAAAYVIMVGAFYTSFIISLFIWMGPYLLFLVLWLGFKFIRRASDKRMEGYE